MSEDWDNAVRVPYEKPEQAFNAGEFFGLAEAAELLKALPEQFRSTPGFHLAMATIDATVQKRRSDMSIVSMKMAARNGIDINTHMVASYPDGLRALPMDLDQLARQP